MDKKMMIDRPMKILKGFLAAWVLIALGIVGAGLVMLLTPAGIKTGSYIIIGAASAGGFLCGSSASSAVGRRFDLRDDSFADDFSGVSSVFRGCRRSVSELPASGTSCGSGSRGRSFRHGGGFFAGGRKRKSMRSPQRI